MTDGYMEYWATRWERLKWRFFSRPPRPLITNDKRTFLTTEIYLSVDWRDRIYAALTGQTIPDVEGTLPRPNFTPGPWRVGGANRNVVYGTEPEYRPSLVVAHCNHTGEVPPEVDAANAHLIAAAPSLYDGCNALIGLIQLVCSRDDIHPEIQKALLTSHRFAEACAAVAKADGQP